jgi:hypothetical protein
VFVPWTVVVAMMVIVVMAGVGTTLTGRLGRHSTSRLTIVATTVLPVSDLDEIVRKRHS